MKMVDFLPNVSSSRSYHSQQIDANSLSNLIVGQNIWLLSALFALCKLVSAKMWYVGSASTLCNATLVSCFSSVSDMFTVQLRFVFQLLSETFFKGV